MRKSNLIKKNIIFGILKTKEEGYFPVKYKIKCKCECGNTKRIYIYNLRNGTTKSCGCKIGKNLKTHGMKNTPIYKVWCGIKERCNNIKHKGYKNYGGRGIAYNKKWEKFEGFYEDMKCNYQKGLQIDRIDNNGNYGKDNCRWVTSKQNNRNRSNNRLYKGKCIAQWCEELGLNYKRVMNRLNKHKWTYKRALDLIK